MIGYFPYIYPDELVYSYLARIGVHNAYLLYSQLSKDLYGKIQYFPSIEFIDKLLPDIEKHLRENHTMQDIIFEHTMFPCYAGFLNPERKMNAYKFIEEGAKGHYKVLPLIKANKPRYLRWCPKCTNEDREKYGETFWHRNHQIMGIDVCDIHGCRLFESDIPISSETSVKLMTAEEATQNTDCNIIDGNDSEKELAKYINCVLQGTCDFKKRDVSTYLNYRMTGTAYLSKRGDIKKLAILCNDFVERYKEIKHTQLADIYMSRLGNILRGKRCDFVEICQLAMLLGITTDELIECKIPEDFEQSKQIREFDAKVTKLLNSGIGVNEVSRRLGISSITTRKIRDNSYKDRKNRQKSASNSYNIRKTKTDWEGMDELLLPKVICCIKELLENTDKRPIRLTKSAVCRMLGISYQRFVYCPLCLNAVTKYCESYDEYWARELVWAVKEIERQGRALNTTNIGKVTNLDKVNIIRGFHCMTDDENKEKIRQCLE